MTWREEYDLQVTAVEYVQRQYPGAIFRSDLGGIRLPIGAAVKVKKIQGDNARNYPDFFLAEPRGAYAGLFLEFKISRDEIFTKRGSLRQSEHVQGQQRMLERLRARGYSAQFACGIDEVMQALDEYMALAAHWPAAEARRQAARRRWTAQDADAALDEMLAQPPEEW